MHFYTFSATSTGRKLTFILELAMALSIVLGAFIYLWERYSVIFKIWFNRTSF